MQGWTQLRLRTMVCGGWDGCLTFYRYRHHKLASITRRQTLFGISLPSSVKFGNALFITNAESAIAHFGVSAVFFAEGIFKRGPDYLSAAVLYESLVIEANAGTYGPLMYPVVAIYPKEGTFFSDHPFVIPQTRWLTPDKKAAALLFRNFLLAPAQQAKALEYGFRPAPPNVALAAPIDQAHGVNPNQPATILQIPSAEVVKAIQDSWNQLRRKVDMLLLLDCSASMNDLIGGIPKISAAKQGLIEFVSLLSDRIDLGLTVFSDQARVLTPVGPLGLKRQEIRNLISGIAAGGSTLLYDTIADQVAKLQALPSKHIKVVIVLTGGKDTDSQLSLDQLIEKITPSGNNKGIRVFTIAYGNPLDINTAALMSIAWATGGMEWNATPQNIRRVYMHISRLF